MVEGMVSPHHPETERAVLGALMVDKYALSLIGDFITADSFYNPAHSDIYKAIQDLYTANSAVDIITVTAHLKKTGKLAGAGGALYVTQLTNNVVSAAHIENHARLIQEAYTLRRLWEAGGRIMNESFQPSADPFDVLAKMEGELQSISTNLTGGASVKEFKEQLKDTVKAVETAAQNKGVTGVPSKFSLINSITGGYQPGDFTIIAARPGMGKSALVMTEARNMAKMGIAVAVFSLEMPYLQINQRLLSGESGIELDSIRKGKLDNDRWKLLNDAVGRMGSWPLHIDDTSSLNILQLRAKARRLKNKKGIKVVIVDYLQLMSGTGKKESNREQEISSISRGLKQLAKELEVPVIALAQLSRAAEKRTSNIPMLSDLRESGSLEQDADVVQFLYRPEYYDIQEYEDGSSTTGVAEAHIAKNRNGALDKCKILFDGPHCNFDNLYERPPMPNVIQEVFTPAPF